MSSVSEIKTEIDALRREVAEAKSASDLSYQLFEASMDQTGRFWSLFKFLATGLAGFAVAAIGFQVVQNHVRLADAVSSADRQINSTVETANGRLADLARQAEAKVEKALARLESADVTSTTILNGEDTGDIIYGDTFHSANYIESTPYSYQLNVRFYARVGFEGNGLSKLTALRFWLSTDFVEALYERGQDRNRRMLSTGKVTAFEPNTIVPGVPLNASFTVSRVLTSCEAVLALERRLVERSDLGTATVQPIFEQAPKQNQVRTFRIALTRDTSGIDCTNLPSVIPGEATISGVPSETKGLAD